jgi:hypothetical protein
MATATTTQEITTMNAIKPTINLTASDLLKVSNLLWRFRAHRHDADRFAEQAAFSLREGYLEYHMQQLRRSAKKANAAAEIAREIEENYGVDMDAICEALAEASA